MTKTSLSFTEIPLLNLGPLDHYTIIVEKARHATEFHVNQLGFKFKYEKCINTGTVPEGEYDMINHVLALPNDPQKICVVTEGLNDETVFRQFIKKYGEGIHHVAYQTSDIEREWQHCQENQIEVTSKTIIHDPVNGLRQFFITRQYTGYFIELIERIEDSEQSDAEFTENNMADLARSIRQFL